MAIDHVIDSGTVSLLELLVTYGFLDWLSLLFCCVFVGLFGAAFSLLPAAISDEVHEREGTDSFYVIGGSIAFVFFFTVLFFGLTTNEAKETSPIHWKEEIAEPYYEELPLITKNIDIISVSGTDDPEVFEITYSEKNANGSLVNETVTAKFVKEKGRTLITYEYKEIAKDIPNFMAQGRYEEVVRIPIDFSFSAK